MHVLMVCSGDVAAVAPALPCHVAKTHLPCSNHVPRAPSHEWPIAVYIICHMRCCNTAIAESNVSQKAGPSLAWFYAVSDYSVAHAIRAAAHSAPQWVLGSISW